VDIPEVYGLLLSRDWFDKIDNYFATYWSHMWLPHKGRCNQIWVLSERYMKNNVTPLNGKNEPLAFAELMFGNCLLEKTLECYPARPALTSSKKQLGLLPHPTNDNETCTICFFDSSSSSNNSYNNNTSMQNDPCTDKLWAMSLDNSGTHDGSRTKCISVFQNNES